MINFYVGDQVEIHGTGALVFYARNNGSYGIIPDGTRGEVIKQLSTSMYEVFIRGGNVVIEVNESNLRKVPSIKTPAPQSLKVYSTSADPLAEVFDKKELTPAPGEKHNCNCTINQLVFGGCICGGK